MNFTVHELYLNKDVLIRALKILKGNNDPHQKKKKSFKATAIEEILAFQGRLTTSTNFHIWDVNSKRPYLPKYNKKNVQLHMDRNDLYPLISCSTLPPSSSPWQPPIFFSRDWSILNMKYTVNKNHTIYDLVYLTSFV